MEATIAARPRYAGFGIRTVAALADALITGIYGWLLGIAADLTGLVAVQWLAVVASGVCGLAYAIAFPALVGWTPGKRLLSLQIVGPESGTAGIGWQATIVRWIGAYVSTFALCLGFLAIITDPKKRGWHDRLARTHVIHE